MDGPKTLQDAIELCKQGYFTILLDESLRGLEAGLEDDGFKVIVPQQCNGPQNLDSKKAFS
jgi:hypothetical protein